MRRALREAQLAGELRLRGAGLLRVPDIGDLTDLRMLDLSGNRLTQLPDRLGDLTNLETLDLSGNRLTQLPDRLGDLTNLETLALGSNPLDDPLPELAERGAHAVLAYLRDRAEDGVPLYEAKVMLVGEGEVGKTSLVSALQGLPFEQGRPTTHGIELASLAVRHPSDDVDITLNLWDFGGQEVYRVTHQFFFLHRALYLLVWKPRQGQQENAVEEWLRMIRARVGSNARVVIVATHGDERRPELDVPYLRDKFGEMVVDQWVVDNESGCGIAELRRVIAAETARLPQVGTLMSKRWIDARDELMAIDEPQIPLGRYEAIADRHGLDRVARQSLAELLHDLGHIVYFGRDEGLRDVMVLQPEWLTKAIGYVLEDQEVRDRGGELDHSRLAVIWQPPNRERYAARYHPYFLRLMEKFDVSYRIPDTAKSLVAQLVPYERPELDWPDEPGMLRELALVCTLSDEAPGLVAWLTVRNYRFSTGKHWRRGVRLAYPQYDSAALLELATPRELRLAVRAPSPVLLFSILRDTIEELIQRRWPGLSYDLLVPCPTRSTDGKACPGRFKLKTLDRLVGKGRPSATCDECVDDVDVARLLIGFIPSSRPATPLLDVRGDQLDRIERDLSRIDARMGETEALSADAAFHIRLVRKAMSVEVTDCPRLFSLETASGGRWRPSRLWRRRLRLSLWCEHPGAEHRCDHQGYVFQESREWFAVAAPYIAMLATLLRLVPVAGAVAGLMVADASPKEAPEARRTKAEIDLMNTIASQVTAPTIERGIPDSGLTPAESHGLRAFRELLFRLDPAKTFAGLSRATTTSGDFVWVCGDHYRVYDPGLPQLSPTPTIPMSQ